MIPINSVFHVKLRNARFLVNHYKVYRFPREVSIVELCEKVGNHCMNGKKGTRENEII